MINILQTIPLVLALLSLTFCNTYKKPIEIENNKEATMTDSTYFKSGYSTANGLKMYYEVYGEGEPLVLIHGGGSTIQTTFGNVILQLAKRRQVVGVELQAHGRTSDRDTDLSFEQDADDVAALLKNLDIAKADFFGFSNGGNTTMQLAIRHPHIVNRIIVGSALFKRSGAPAQFWEFMKQATIDHMPQQYKDAYKAIAPDPNHLQTMHDKCAKRMVEFKDMSDEQIRSIKAPTLIINGNNDIATSEHALEMHRLIPKSQLAIVPGGHGAYIGEITTLSTGLKSTGFMLPMIEDFLDYTPDTIEN